MRGTKRIFQRGGWDEYGKARREMDTMCDAPDYAVGQRCQLHHVPPFIYTGAAALKWAGVPAPVVERVLCWTHCTRPLYLGSAQPVVFMLGAYKSPTPPPRPACGPSNPYHPRPPMIPSGIHTGRSDSASSVLSKINRAQLVDRLTDVIQLHWPFVLR